MGGIGCLEIAAPRIESSQRRRGRGREFVGLVSMRWRRAGEIGNCGSDRRAVERMFRIDAGRAGGCYRIGRDGAKELRRCALERPESRFVVFGVPHADALVGGPAALKTS